MSAAFSPDGAWIAFDSDESGRREVHVARRGNTTHIAVSSAGGERPSWSADGRTIYFHEGGRLVRVGFDPDRDPHIGPRDVAFDRPDARVLGVAPNGRLLIERQPVTPDAALVILQWLRELRQRLPAPVTAPR